MSDKNELHSDIYNDIDTNVGKCCPEDVVSNKKPYTITDRFKSKFPLDKCWNAVEFILVNPTEHDCNFTLFDGWSIIPTPNTPYGWIPPVNNTAPVITEFPPLPPSPLFYPSIENAFPDLSSLYFQVLAAVYVPSTNRVYIAATHKITFSIDIFVIDVVTNNVVNVIPSKINGTSSKMVFNSVMNRVYLTNGTTKISVIDCALETEINIITVPSFVGGEAYNPTNNSLYVTQPATGRVRVIDCATLVQSSIILSGTPVDIDIWIDGINTFGLVTNITTNFFKLDCVANTLLATIVTPFGTPQTGGLCYNSVKKANYYIEQNGVNKNIREIDMNTNTILPLIISANKAITLDYVSAYNVIYFDNLSSEVKIIDCVTDTVAKTVPVSFSSSVIGGRFAYAPTVNKMFVTDSADANHNFSVLVSSSNPPATCYITGSTEYNEFIQDFSRSPKCVRQIVLYAPNAHQVNIPFNLLIRDANGLQVNVPYLPNTTLSTDQFQPNIATLDFSCKELILDNQYVFSQYLVPANTKVPMIVYYCDITKVEIMTGFQEVCDISEAKCQGHGKCDDGNSRTESELLFSSPRPHTRPLWLRPFEDSMITDTNVGKCCPDGGIGKPVKQKVSTETVSMEDVYIKPFQKERNTDVCCPEGGIGKQVKQKVSTDYISLDDVYEKSFNKETNKGITEDIGRPIFKAELSKAPVKEVVIDEVYKVNFEKQTNVGMCCPDAVDSKKFLVKTKKTDDLNVFYAKAVEEFSVHYEEQKPIQRNSDWCEIIDL
jgi:hypothetical protein